MKSKHNEQLGTDDSRVPVLIHLETDLFTVAISGPHHIIYVFSL